MRGREISSGDTNLGGVDELVELGGRRGVVLPLPVLVAEAPEPAQWRFHPAPRRRRTPGPEPRAPISRQHQEGGGKRGRGEEGEAGFLRRCCSRALEFWGPKMEERE